jgi:hypothetical protein
VGALASYVSSASLGLILAVAGIDVWLIPWAWAATAIAWFFAAFYGLFRAPEELEALRG